MTTRTALMILILGFMLLMMLPLQGQLNCSGGPLGCTGLTSGSIPFISATGSLTENNSALAWDNTNQRLTLRPAANDRTLVINRQNSATEAILLGADSGANPQILMNNADLIIGKGNITVGLQAEYFRVVNGGGVTVSASALTSVAYATATKCASSGGTCGSAAAGSVTIGAAATTVTVSTTALKTNSQVLIQEDSTLGTLLGVTCNTTIARTYAVTTQTVNTSFVITASAAPVTNPACLNYFVVN